ncbi:MAG: hypothetical protein ACJ73S_23870 [Mycobacteriales bacterium]
MRALMATLLAATAAAVLWWPAAAHAAGTVYYVDSSAGRDANSGSASAAWKSLSKVNGFGFLPGDTVKFKRGGTWTGTLTLSRSGKQGSPITVDAYGDGSLPTITGNVTNCVTVSGSWWVIDNLRATNCDWAGVEFQGSHELVDSIQADNNIVGVSITHDSTFNTVRWSRIVNNNKMVPGTTGSDDDSGAFGILVNGDDNLISRNVISGSFAHSDDYTYDGSAVEIYDGDRNHVEYNTTSDNETFTELGHESGETADGNTFDYNLVTTTEPRGSFLVTRGYDDHNLGPVTHTEADNNTVYLPQGDSQGFVCDAGCGPDILRLRNNVIEAGWKTGYSDGPVDEDNGVYDGPVAQFTAGPNSVFADPQFVSTTDFHLRSTSPAIGRGVWLGYPYDLDGDDLDPNTPVDSGAYQH